jgi:hypothetical protein
LPFRVRLRAQKNAKEKQIEYKNFNCNLWALVTASRENSTNNEIENEREKTALIRQEKEK